MSVSELRPYPAYTPPSPEQPLLPSSPTIREKARAILDFELPQLEAKIRLQGLAETPARSRELVQEMKKYLFVSWLSPKVAAPMCSCLIDAVWHQFVLFTRAYASFCERFFGSFHHHVPSNPGDAGDDGDGAQVMSFEAFRDAYEDLFGPLSPAWFDHLSLTQTTRLNWTAPDEPRAVRVETGRVVLFRNSGVLDVLCYASLRARAGLEFMARERAFLVRELPGPLQPSERLELCRPLVECGLLKLDP